MSLYFAGLEKISLIDYPGHLAAIGFTYGCNMRCPYCHNPELVTEKLDTSRIYSQQEVLKFLQSRIGKLDGFSLTGGEPTMHKGIDQFFRKVKDLGFSTKLDSNGSNPQVLEDLIENGLVDYIAMDVKYADELYRQGIYGGQKIDTIKQSIALIMSKAKDYEFRTTVSRSFHNEKAMHEIGSMIKGAKRYFIQNFNAGKTIDPTLTTSESFTEKELKEFKKIMEKYVAKVEIRG